MVEEMPTAAPTELPDGAQQRIIENSQSARQFIHDAAINLLLDAQPGDQKSIGAEMINNIKQTTVKTIIDGAERVTQVGGTLEDGNWQTEAGKKLERDGWQTGNGQQGRRREETINYQTDGKDHRSILEGPGWKGAPDFGMELDCSSKWPSLSCQGFVTRSGSPVASVDLTMPDQDHTLYRLFSLNRNQLLGSLTIDEKHDDGRHRDLLSIEVKRELEAKP